MRPICFCGFPHMQCLSSTILAGSPFPSHPTGRSVFPSPAVRQSSSHSMRRLSLVPDDSAPDVDHSPGVQSRIGIFLPPKASAFTAIVQIHHFQAGCLRKPNSLRNVHTSVFKLKLSVPPTTHVTGN